MQQFCRNRDLFGSIDGNAVKGCSLIATGFSKQFLCHSGEGVHDLSVKRLLNAFTSWVPTVIGKVKECRCFPFRVWRFAGWAWSSLKERYSRTSFSKAVMRPGTSGDILVMMCIYKGER